MDDVTLRPIEEDDLDELRRFALDPEAASDFEWLGYSNPQMYRKRWEEDGWIGEKATWLAVARPDGAIAGIVSFRDWSFGADTGQCYQFGIALFPEHRGQGIGTAAQRLLVQYLFDNTRANRLQAFTEVDNQPEQRSLEKAGLEREAVLRGTHFRKGQWRDSVLYAVLRT